LQKPLVVASPSILAHGSSRGNLAHMVVVAVQGAPQLSRESCVLTQLPVLYPARKGPDFHDLRYRPCFRPLQVHHPPLRLESGLPSRRTSNLLLLSPIHKARFCQVVCLM
jgi:hypothetical protein